MTSSSAWLNARRSAETCTDRGISYTQGLAQSIRDWLDANPSPRHGARGTDPERKIVGNQKGGVGKTAISAGIGEAYAEAGKRVLVVDFDPQGHLSEQLGVPQIEPNHDSLVSHMCGEGRGDLRDLVLEIDDPRYEKRLHVLPACFDGFLLDAKIAVVATQKRGFQKEAALELALRPLEADYDVIIVDCPPSLGIAMDAALYVSVPATGRSRITAVHDVSGMPATRDPPLSEGGAILLP
ncbi:hypothetical protein SHKM778_45320 [Streptomyces sp. KM77-8]|uniref:AAA domain-containing protein n=1 Tax=Streptomyces haneummycinicus TaxID=3074435 RepID=A0AAT9HLF4_9ACTN